MARPATRRLRELWLNVHRWIGLLLAVLIIPISLTGAILVWNEDLDQAFHPQRSAVSQTSPALGPSAYVKIAQASFAPGERILSIRYPAAGEKAVIVTTYLPPSSKGRPSRNRIWLDPATGRLLDKAASNAGILMAFHRLHGSLMVPGWGRTIVGWVGAFMFVSCLTGIWLWWPIRGSARQGFRWRRRNTTSANLHHFVGFWVLLPLAMLSFTGVWISFPSLFGKFEARPLTRSGESEGQRAIRAQPLALTHLTPEEALGESKSFGTGALASIAWPTDEQAEWKISYDRGGGARDVSIDDRTRKVTLRPPPPKTNARLMRRLHDGTDMGLIWRIMITLGGLIPAILAVTGILMWLKARAPSAELAQKRSSGRKVVEAAE